MYPSISAKQEIILPDESSIYIYFNLVIKLLVFHPSTVKAKQKTNLELFCICDQTKQFLVITRK